MSPPVRIVLTGFMGAGKTTVGRLLAERLRWAFFDLDDTVVQSEGQSIASLFATVGEAAFREREHAALQRVLPRDFMVLALGGGAIESEANRTLLHSMPETRVIFLEAPLAVLVARCEQEQARPKGQPAIRPILADRERLVQRFTERLPHYRTAHLTIATADREPADTVEAIMTTFNLSLKLPSHP
ncbi:MAG TPA: shikimate kinase [Acidobacteriaceae bacterium]|nr:shikimate kinase [Acidobacteriaceae bacterium]